MQNYKVIIIGGGPSGITCSYYLKKYGLSHLMLEKREVLHTWEHERWDSFYLVTPNWMTNLPGMENELPYDNEYMSKKEILSLLKRYLNRVSPNVQAHTNISEIRYQDGFYEVTTDRGVFYAEHIIVATGMYSRPYVPSLHEDLPKNIYQVHSSLYKNPLQLEKGNTLVVGSGWSGIQIAMEIKAQTKSEVYLSLGRISALPTLYRNIHGVYWLNRLSGYNHEKPVLSYRKEDFQNQNIVMKMNQNLEACYQMGVHFLGRLMSLDHGVLQFSNSLGASIKKHAEDLNAVKEKIESLIQSENHNMPSGDLDRDLGILNPDDIPSKQGLSIENDQIRNVIWCTGFKRDYSWIKRPIFDESGLPELIDGVKTNENIYFCGLGLEVDRRLKSAYGVGLYAIDESAKRAVMAVLENEGA